MATTRARASKKAAANSSTLLNAVKFVAMTQKEIGNVFETHCAIRAGWIAATNGVMTMGAKVVDDLTACPQTARLVQALARCGSEVAITQADSSALTVKSGPLRVKIPCVEPEAVPIQWADPLIAPMDDRFTEALRTVHGIANEHADKMFKAAILCRDKTVLATDGHVIAETHHGIETPPAWNLPKASSVVLTSIDKKLIGFGYSGRSATFHFEDESWFRTQLYEDEFINPEKIFRQAQQLTPAPATLFEALTVIAPLLEDDVVSFSEGALTAGDDVRYEVADLKAGTRFNAKQLLKVAPIFKTYEIDTQGVKPTIFFGGNSRGAIARMNESRYDNVPPPSPLQSNSPNANMDDDIPF